MPAVDREDLSGRERRRVARQVEHSAIDLGGRGTAFEGERLLAFSKASISQLVETSVKNVPGIVASHRTRSRYRSWTSDVELGCGIRLGIARLRVQR